MSVDKILSEFNNVRDKIRQNTIYKVPVTDLQDGLTMAMNYSDVIEYVTKSLFDITSENLGIDTDGSGIGIFLYGSPGRREMVCESDLDVMLIYKDKSKIYQTFQNQFTKFAEPFNFCKIDLPEWGTLKDAEIFAKKSVTEGNQVLEARFVTGDVGIKNSVDKIQEQYGGPDRMVRNIVFQKFYFDQYFKQRVRDGAINIKYCDGGSRDYLFIHWFNKLMTHQYDGWDQTKVQRPVAEIGLSNLYKNGLLSSLEFGRAIESLHFNISFRNEILLVNKGTKDEGLTFLDERTLTSVYESLPNLMDQYNIENISDLKQQFDRQRFHISGIKDRIWHLMIKEKSKELGGHQWSSDFLRAYDPKLSESEREKLISYDDELMRIALLWGASNSKQQNLFNKIVDKEKNSESWEIQASLTTSPICSSEHLHHIGTGLGKELGYGYILSIISRNPNVTDETLKSIAYDENLETRYRVSAEAALKYGRDAANHQL